jgi:hypothetical protein
MSGFRAAPLLLPISKVVISTSLRTLEPSALAPAITPLSAAMRRLEGNPAKYGL